MLFSDAEGRISDQAPRISLLDHGFLFGDSIYEVLRTYDGLLFGWQEHMDRLAQSARRLALPLEPLLPEIAKRADALLAQLGEPNAAIRIFVTRGVGKLHIDPRSCTKPVIYMAAWPFDAGVHLKPLRLAVTKIQRLTIESLDPAIKSGNYLNAVLAFHEAIELGYDDAILLNSKGEVAELTTSNIGWISNGKIVTPATGSGILYGITRKLCLDCDGGMVEGHYTESDLKKAEEVFALSTFKEIVPVTEVRFSDGSIKSFSNSTKTKEFHEKLKRRIAVALKSCRKVC